MIAVEPFEKALRENTPLTSTLDANALVEYLGQLNLKGDMVTEELKRVSRERDTFKQKLDEAEKSTREAWDAVAGLRAEKEGIVVDDTSVDNALKEPSTESAANVSTENEKSKSPSDTKSPTSPTRSLQSSIPSISLFSPKPMAKADVESEKKILRNSSLMKMRFLG